MAFNLYTSLTTRSSPHIRRMGYIDEAIAMRDRYDRRREAWQSHLINARSFVLSAARQCRNRNKVVILGSGLLLDIPLAELSSLFREVVLMDVVCLPQVRRLIRKYDNARFVEHDVTNMAVLLDQNKRFGIRELPSSIPVTAETYGNPDLVVSLNILSQLWVVPRSFAMKEMPGIAEEQIDDWCRSIVAQHYSLLRDLTCSVCLIADYEYVRRDIEGKAYCRESTIFNFPLPEPDSSWTWCIGPLGEESLYRSKELIVGAWHFQ
jgi:hypothetical protein